MRKLSFSVRHIFLLFALVGAISGGVFYKVFETQIVAALSSVTLNNGVTTLDDALPLSSQEDLSVGEIGAYTWTKDSTNVMSLNMPFNSGAAQNDYSGYGNNGTVTDAVVTTAGCQVGTCLAFDGNADYVTIPDSPVWNFSDELTVSLWYSSTQADVNGQALISQGESAGQYSFLMWASGSTNDDNMSFYIQTNPAGITSVGCSAAEGTLFDGEWHHYVGVYDRAENELRMYIDGAPACGTQAVVNQPLYDYAGGVHLGRLPFDTSYANGILDEVQVYSEVLSEDQIDRLYSDGFAQSGGPTVIEADETTVGEVWDLTITPITTAGTPGSPIDSANTVSIVSGGGGGLNVSLNNGNAIAQNSDPITSQVTGLSSDIGAYQWSVSNTPFMSLNIPFNSGGTQTDFSGNGRNGTVVGPVIPPSPGTDCKVGTCLDFDASNDYVSIAGTFGGGSEATVSAWMKVEANTGTFQAVLSTLNQSFIHLQINTQGSGNIAIYTNDTTILLPMINVPLGEWHHIAISAQSGSTKAYVDGVEVSSDASTFSTINSTTSLNIGRGFGGGRLFNGMIDEVQVYPRALTDVQITQIYNDGNAEIGGPTIIDPAETTLGEIWDLTITPIATAGTVGSSIDSFNTVTISDPVIDVSLNNNIPSLSTNSNLESQVTGLDSRNGAYRWTVDGSNLMSLNMPFNTGSTQTDFSGYAVTSTSNNVTYTSLGCKVGGCLVLNGSNAYVDAGTAPSLQIGGEGKSFSLEAWSKRASSSRNEMLFSQGTSGTNLALHFGYRSNDSFTFAFYNNDLDTAPSADGDGWHHWVGTYNGLTNERKIYKDGQLVANDTPATDYLGTGAPFYVGAFQSGSAYFSGSMDEVRVYTHALSSGQVSLNYLDGLGLGQNEVDGVGGPTIIHADETTDGEVWDLTVTPINLDGTLDTPISSTNTVTISPATVPGTPTGLDAIAGDTEVILDWTAPLDDGGSAITDYVVQYSDDNFSTDIQTFNDGESSSTGATVTGLTNDTLYYFRVAAVNSEGQGPYSLEQTATPTDDAPLDGSQSDIQVSVQDYISFAITNVAVGDEAAGNQPFGAGTQKLNLSNQNAHASAITGEYLTPVYTELEISTNSTDGFSVRIYADNTDNRTAVLARVGGNPLDSDDLIVDTVLPVNASQAQNDTLSPASDSGIAIRLQRVGTSAELYENDEETQWGIDDTTNARWASPPLGLLNSQVIVSTSQFNAGPLQALINWFIGIDVDQRAGIYTGQVNLSAAMN